MPKPIVRSFEAFKRLPVNALQIAQLLSNCEILEGDQLAAEFKNFFETVSASIDNDPAHLQKLEAFLNTAGELVPGFKQQLAAINADYQQYNDINLKNTRLKELFESLALSNYFAKYWKEHFANASAAEGLTSQQKIQRIFEKGNQQTANEYEQAAHQGIYRLETQVVRNAIKILFQLIDASFISAGIIQKPMYEHMYGSAEGAENDNFIPMPSGPGKPPVLVPNQGGSRRRV